MFGGDSGKRHEIFQLKLWTLLIPWDDFDRDHRFEVPGIGELHNIYDMWFRTLPTILLYIDVLFVTYFASGTRLLSTSTINAGGGRSLLSDGSRSNRLDLHETDHGTR